MDGLTPRTQRLLMEKQFPSHRVISQLQSASLVGHGPKHAKQRLKGSRAKGMTYQRRVGRKLSPLGKAEGLGLVKDQWIYFIDRNGHGYAQPDLYFLGETRLLLLECKLTQSDSAEDQCRKLYEPLLRQIYGLPIVSCQVFKNIRYRTQTMVENWDELLTKTDGHWQWHYLAE